MKHAKLYSNQLQALKRGPLVDGIKEKDAIQSLGDSLKTRLYLGMAVTVVMVPMSLRLVCARAAVCVEWWTLP